MSVTDTRVAGKEKQLSAFERAKNYVDAHLTKLPTAAAVLLFVSMIIYGEMTYGRIVQYSTLRSEEHTSELQSRGHLVCRLLLEKKKKKQKEKTNNDEKKSVGTKIDNTDAKTHISDSIT